MILGQKLRVLEFEPGNLAIGINKLEAYKEIFENLVTCENRAFLRFMNNELSSFLYDPKKLFIPNPPRNILLNFDVSSHPDAFANFLTSEEIFGAERYHLRAEKPIQEEKFWEQLVDVSPRPLAFIPLISCEIAYFFRNTLLAKIHIC